MPSPAGRIFRALAVALPVTLVVGACSYRSTNLVPPVPETAQTSIVLARDGSLIVEPPSDENRTSVIIDEIPQVMLDAVVAIEDERFYLHDGVDLKALVREKLA